MNSDLPKVLHDLCGRPMLSWVLDAAAAAGCEPIVGVIGHQADRVKEAFASSDPPVHWVVQSPQLGTGHAVMCCRDELARLSGPVLVIGGDGPLVRPETLRQVLEAHDRERAACTLATCLLPDPGRYGRVLRDEHHQVTGIVEYLDADERQRRVREVNVSLYCFDAARLRDALGRLTHDNAKGEYYLTDTLELLRDAGGKLAAVPAATPEDVLSINTTEELQAVERILQDRLAAAGADHGR